jgi:hypothetical protein
VNVGVDELLDQIAADLAPDVDGLALEVLRRIVTRRTRELLLGVGAEVHDGRPNDGDDHPDIDDQAHDRNDVVVDVVPDRQRPDGERLCACTPVPLEA